MPKDLTQEIFAIIRERAGEDINLHDRLEDTRLDSLEFTELCMDLEERYKLTSDLAFDFYQPAHTQTTDLMPREQSKTIKQFIDYVSAQVNSEYAST